MSHQGKNVRYEPISRDRKSRGADLGEEKFPSSFFASERFFSTEARNFSIEQSV